MKVILTVLTVVVMLFGSAVNIANAQEDDECMFGPTAWKELMNNPKISESSRTTFTENYNDAVREEEIKAFIDDNLDDLNVPDWMDSDLVLCGVARDVVDKEKELGMTLDGKDLERNVKLAILTKSLDTIKSLSDRMN